MKFLLFLLLFFVPFSSYAIECTSTLEASFGMPYDQDFVILDYYPGLDSYDMRGFWTVPGYRYDGVSGCVNITDSSLVEQFNARANHFVSTDTETITYLAYLGESGCTPGYGKWERHAYLLEPITCTGEPAEPVECSDFVLSGDEQGIDCGGSCLAACDLICPDGLEPLTGVGEVWEGKCYGGIFAVNALGDCPPNTVAGTGEDTVACVGIEEPFLVSNSFLPSDITSMGIPPIDYSFQGNTYEFSQDSTSTTEDNGDGTSTTTTIITSASGEGTDSSSETTTRVDVVDNSSSAILSSSITTVVNESANDNLETFGFDQGIPDNVYDSDITADLPDLLEIDADGGFFDSFISNSSFFTVLNSGQINTSNPVCSLTTPAIFQNDANPSGFTLDFDLCPWESHLQTVGALLLIICQFYALFIVYRGWRA